MFWITTAPASGMFCDVHMHAQQLSVLLVEQASVTLTWVGLHLNQGLFRCWSGLSKCSSLCGNRLTPKP